MTDRSLLYLHTRLETPGGANRFVVETAERLTDAGVSVILATGTLDADRYPLSDDVFLVEYGGPPPGRLGHWVRLPVILRRLLDALADRSFDAVVLQSIPLPYWTPVLRRLLPDARFYWFAHDPNAYLNEPGKLADVPTPLRTVLRTGLPAVRWADRRLVARLDGIVANSEYTASVIRRVYGHDPPVVYPGVDTKAFTPSNATGDGDYVFTVGQLNEFNNFDLLLAAMAHCYEDDVDAPDLVVGGEGPAEPSLRRATERLGITDRVEFTGYLPEQDLKRHYATASAVAYLPEHEPFGLVPVEAMASGTPVVALAGGGPDETVVDGETGRLVDDRTPGAVAGAIADVAADPDTATRMGRAARDRVVSSFTWDRTTDALHDVLFGSPT